MAGRTIIGVFDETGAADRAIDALQNAGISDEQIYHSGRHTGDFFEGLKNFFTGRDTADDITKDLTGMGVSDEEARYYDGEHDAGRTIVAVNAAGHEQEVQNILYSSGAYNYAMRSGRTGGTTTATSQTTGTTDYADTSTTRGDDYTTSANTDRTTDYADTTRTGGYNTADTSQTAGYADTTRTGGYNTAGTDTDVDTDEQRRLRLREEQLNVNKQRVQSGEVNLRKDVVEEPQTFNVPVTHEEAYVERRPVAEGTYDDATPIGQDESVRIPITDERVNVNKETRVTGEVNVGKRPVQENQQVSDTVRREEPRFERSGDTRVTGEDAYTNDPRTTDTRSDDTRNDL